MLHTPLSLLAHEIMTQHFGKSPDTDDVGAAVERVYATLMINLSFFLGEIGSMALIRRSLRLTEGLFPWLATLRDTEQHDVVNALGRCLDQQAPDGARDASIVILASLFEMLAKLIGVQLTVQIARETWPDVRLSIIRRAENE